MNKTLGNKIRKIRELRGYSQQYVSSKLELSQNALSKMENGRIKIDASKLDKIASVLDVEVKNILSFSENFLFHNFNESGQISTNDNPNIKIVELYERIIAQLQSENLQLKTEIVNSVCPKTHLFC